MIWSGRRALSKPYISPLWPQRRFSGSVKTGRANYPLILEGPMTDMSTELAKLAMERLRQQRGMLSRIAEGLSISAQAVSQWEMVPLERIIDVEQVTKIPRHRLRPVYHQPESHPKAMSARS
jgi:hypothetical protein